jgi:signal transduction histidine kinase
MAGFEAPAVAKGGLGSLFGAWIWPRANPPASIPTRGDGPPWVRRLLRSAGFRFAAVYAVLLGLSALALAMFLWWETAGVLDRQTDAAIAADADDLLARWNQSDGGIPAVQDAIEQRLRENIDDDAIYLLVDPWMRRVAGNLPSWPEDIAAPGDDWLQLRLTRTGWKSVARAEIILLPGGYHLLVGRDVEVRAHMADMLTAALLWALLVVAALATIGALIVRNMFSHTIASVSATAAAIAAGDLSRRVRLSGRGDEFDLLAETINDMLDRIGRLMDGVRQVSNSIAHDLRTPIARARARLEDAATSARRDEELRAAVERAIVDLDQISDIFQALLRISEIEAGSKRSAFAWFDVAPMLADLAELYGAVAEEGGVHLVLSAPDHLNCFGDRSLVQQAVANLVDNAIKFSPQGGRICLEASAVDTGVEIVTTDNGPGMPATDIVRAGERFFRGEAARHTPGSGLGLALVQAVAVLHGGELRLADRDPGLRATLWLPGRDAPRTELPRSG